jgi:hypothetical protein
MVSSDWGNAGQILAKRQRPLSGFELPRTRPPCTTAFGREEPFAALQHIFRSGQTTTIYAATPHWFQSKKLMTGVGCTPEVGIESAF